MEERIKELENKVEVLTKNLIEVLEELHELTSYDNDKGYLDLGHFTLDGFSSSLMDFSNSIKELKALSKPNQEQDKE